MPIYNDVPTFDYYPNPELRARSLHAHIDCRSILDVGAGHGGVFDKEFWDKRDMDTREACDIFWIRPMGPGWFTKTKVDACELTKHYPEKSFDFVQCIETLEHIPDSAKALRELCKIATKFIFITSADEGHHRGPEQAAIEKINEHQKYVVQPSVKVMKELGFDVRVETTVKRQLIAWKYLQ